MGSDAVPAVPEVVPLQMPDGTVTPIRVFSGVAGRPVFVVWPGLGLPAVYYDKLAVELTVHGFNVVVSEIRGQGSSEPTPDRESNFGYHELVAVDMPAAFEVAHERFPDSAPYVLGHSFGGQLAMLYAARVGHEIAGIVLIAAGSPYYKTFPGARALGPLVAGKAMSLTASIAGYWPGDKVNIAGFGRQPRLLISDWSRFARTGRLAPGGADIDYEERLREITVPVLSISLSRDDVAPSSSVQHLVGKLEAATVTNWRNPERRNHLDWMKAPAAIADRIASWLGEMY
ncbi:alpha/beta fold hydrolase [Hoyosella sp. YIM 151337]|uniref:alpha/beta hydrolase family protein n=1 Tax=Hoyosella sp. YIM 151337 TaxID=2992742 RepID=UPI002235CEB8|nr:alpha/beta fold hydrolase [Hoyosella sp. YIM 151337]MCW4353360.1 alpha/beta fold hydrolase [Hoyosella sp. YIM 151337]